MKVYRVVVVCSWLDAAGTAGRYRYFRLPGQSLVPCISVLYIECCHYLATSIEK